jgi:hypothetical protein
MVTFRRAAFLAIALVVSTTILIRTVNHLLPTANGMVGTDYRYFLPYLLSGTQWISQNGWLTIPYFTPDYCGGVPWLANPQSIFYSLPQFLTLLTNPVTAINWTAVIFATVGAAASYGLFRRCFGGSLQGASLVFALFQLNSFLLFRIAIGHLTYDIFGLIPALCWLVLLPAPEGLSVQTKLIRTAGAIIAGGAVLAMMVYAGATNYVIPAVLSVVAVLLIHQARAGWRWGPWCTLVGAALWALPLSAVKLFPAYIFIRSYSRPYIPDYLFSDPIRFVKVLSASLFAPGVLPNSLSPIYGSPHTMGLHEFEYGVSIVPLLLIPAAILLNARKPSRPQHLFAWIGLALVVAIPIALTVGNEAWGQTLLKIPIINNNTTFVRWWSIYIMPLIIAAGLSFDRVFRDTRTRDVMLGAGILLVVAQVTSRDLSYYERENNLFGLYDPTPVVAAVGRVSAGVFLPEISQVGTPPPDGPKRSVTNDTNDGLIWGISAYPCYETVFGYFGYSGELFPAHQLRVGPVNFEVDGHLNLVDPRCYLSSEEGVCPAGALFREDERSDVAKFTSRQPLPWRRPMWQRVAESATIISGAFSTLALLAFFIAGAVCRRTGPR